MAIEEITSYFYVGITSTVNVVLYAATFGHFLFLEGRIRFGRFRNWAFNYEYKPHSFHRPNTEAEIVELIRNSTRVRVCGSGHSFNSGIISDEVLVNLDNYAGVLAEDLEKMQLTVRAGTRMRDVTKELLKRDLAFKALPSHDAQSIAGILATDVHGTGRDWGFVSELVVSLKVITGKGDVIVCEPDDDLFKAAVGGIGAVGIITEVTVQAVPRFNIDQKVSLSTIPEVAANLDNLLSTHDHLSLYVFPFTQRCQVNTWDATSAKKSWCNLVREFISISFDALSAAWLGNAIAYLGLLPWLTSPALSIKSRGTNLVMESAQGYNRSIYHRHQELEFTVPYKDVFAENGPIKKFVRLYEKLYREGPRLPYPLFEIRFTPSGHTRTLLGPGQERQCVWIDLVLNDSANYEIFYAAAEELMKEIGARPHLGKFNLTYTRKDLEDLYGEVKVRKFRELMSEHDPDGKFANGFTARLFEEVPRGPV